MTINILICTYNSGIRDVAEVLMPYHPSITYKVSHQYDDEKYKKIPEVLTKRTDVSVRQIKGKGLCLNRNNSLLMADADICFIADDDVKYNINNVLEAANQLYLDPTTSILIGKISTNEGEPDFKKYPDKEYQLGLKDVGHVSSIEIILKRADIEKSGILFDTSFGIGGSLYNKGEESVFLSDAIKNKLKILFSPRPIVFHSYESSGRISVYDMTEAKYYGALFYRIFKNWAYFLGFVLCFCHLKRYHSNLTWYGFLRAYFCGIKQYKLRLNN